MSLVRGLKLWERPDERKISLYGLYTTGRDLLDWYHFSRRERGAYELARDAREGAMARRAASEDAPADIEDGYTGVTTSASGEMDARAVILTPQGMVAGKPSTGAVTFYLRYRDVVRMVTEKVGSWGDMNHPGISGCQVSESSCAKAICPLRWQHSAPSRRGWS